MYNSHQHIQDNKISKNYSEIFNYKNKNLSNHTPISLNENIINQLNPYKLNTNQNFSDTNLSYNENINVFLRVRPLNNSEINREDSKCIEFANQNTIFFNNIKNTSRNYSFNYIFGENSSQDDVYKYCEIHVNKFINKFLYKIFSWKFFKNIFHRN